MSHRASVAEGGRSWVASSKIEPSLPKVDLVVRERLFERLNAALRIKLELVVVPAGFGAS